MGKVFSFRLWVPDEPKKVSVTFASEFLLPQKSVDHFSSFFF